MNYRYFISTAILIALLVFASTARADQAVGWYFGKWNCTLAKSSMAINITLDGDGVAVGRARIGQSGHVNLRLISASASAIALSDQGDGGNSSFTMRLAPKSNPKRTEGTGTIDGLADPLICTRHPATPQSIRRIPSKLTPNLLYENSRMTEPLRR